MASPKTPNDAKKSPAVKSLEREQQQAGASVAEAGDGGGTRRGARRYVSGQRPDFRDLFVDSRQAEEEAEVMPGDRYFSAARNASIFSGASPASLPILRASSAAARRGFPTGRSSQ